MKRNQQNIPFDLEPMKQHFAGDEDIMVEFIESFINSLPELIQKVETAISNQSGPELQIGAHTLKGLISNFFLENLRSELQELEDLGKNQSLDHSSEKFKNIRSQLDDLKPQLLLLLKENQAA